MKLFGRKTSTKPAWLLGPGWGWDCSWDCARLLGRRDWGCKSWSRKHRTVFYFRLEGFWLNHEASDNPTTPCLLLLKDPNAHPCRLTVYEYGVRNEYVSDLPFFTSLTPTKPPIRTCKWIRSHAIYARVLVPDEDALALPSAAVRLASAAATSSSRMLLGFRV